MRHQNWRRRTVVLAATDAAIVATPLSAAAGGDPTTELVSVSSAGEPGQHGATSAAMSADGRFVAFTSATTPDTQDTGRRDDVLLRDLRRQSTLRVSDGAGGETANGDGYGRAMTPDARHVAFTSTASNLMTGGTATNGLYVRGPLRPQSGHSKGRSR